MRVHDTGRNPLGRLLLISSVSSVFSVVQPSGLPNELNLDRLRDDPRFVGPAEQRGDGFAAAFAEIERPVVDVHAHERVGLAGVEVAAVLHGVGEGFLAMVEPVLDALLGPCAAHRPR